MNHLLKLLDLSKEEILGILNLADQLKYELGHGIRHPLLAGKTLGMIFQKASTRTRVSFETFIRSFRLNVWQKPPACRIMIRTFDQEEVETLARVGSIPVINGLTDFCHPCQVLADLMTVREHKGILEGLKMAYIGDGNNMANSLIVGGLKTGMRVAAACPDGYRPAKEVLDFTADFGDAFTLTGDCLEAAAGADVIFTDVWASMGQEGEAEKRRAAFKGYQVNGALLAAANPGCMVQHCLPAHRGEEITAEVFEAHAQEIFDEAENRLHAQKAVMVTLMK